ncbi:hypothetical protein FOZ62_030243 [Perkinsus olseni]|uniref:Uncharacterized protein n=1 Tax=Perkinsus olseni TaxID=32597 RepID=A0A7J6SXX7_PEROL|nr:hypothetical protein FOZ62_030243 [Perkinsus olseni]
MSCQILIALSVALALLYEVEARTVGRGPSLKKRIAGLTAGWEEEEEMLAMGQEESKTCYIRDEHSNYIQVTYTLSGAILPYGYDRITESAAASMKHCNAEVVAAIRQGFSENFRGLNAAPKEAEIVAKLCLAKHLRCQ